MPREGAETRRRIIDTAYEVFYKAGFARASVDAIAEAAKVTKRTLYYHFDSKDALLAAVLNAQHELVCARIHRWATHTSGDPAKIVQTLFDEFKKWADKPNWYGSGFTRATMELADMPGHPARLAAHRHKAAIEDWLAEQFAGGGIRGSRELAREIMLLIEGCHSLVLIHGDTSYIDTASATARLLVSRSRLRGARGRGNGRARAAWWPVSEKGMYR